MALTHHFYAYFLHQHSSKFKSVLWLNPMIFLLILFMYMLANPNLYFVSIPSLFCLFPSYIERSLNLYFDPSFFFLIPLYTFNEIQICTSVNPINVSAHFLYIKIYANPNLYFGSNPSFFFLIPQYTFNEIQICTSANPMIFCLFHLCIQQTFTLADLRGPATFTRYCQNSLEPST